MINNKKEAHKELPNNLTSIINAKSTKSQIMPEAQNILIEWSLIDWSKPDKGNGLIKLYIEKRNKTKILFLLTEKNGLKIEDLIGYELKMPFNRIKKMSTIDALRLYIRLLNNSIKNLQSKQYKEAC